jgi:hypothetical protein
LHSDYLEFVAEDEEEPQKEDSEVEPGEENK